MRVVVLGGGYAGLACLIDLRKNLREVDLHLVDAEDAHLVVTHLHQTLDRPRTDFLRAFASLGDRYDFHHHRAAPSFDQERLREWQQQKRIPLTDGALAFDKLVIATGARALPLPGNAFTCTLEDFRHREGRELFDAFRERSSNRPEISVVGGGATGLQFLFVLHAQLQRRSLPGRIRLIDLDDALLPHLPRVFHRTLARRLRAAGIAYLPRTRYLGQRGTEIHLQERSPDGNDVWLPSDWTLIFSGVTPSPLALVVNRYGQIVIDGEVLEDLFAAGDCAIFSGGAGQTLTAQAAVHQGKQVATNIRRLGEGRYPLRYAYREKGFFLSLGPRDGIGWLGFKGNVFRGLAAVAVKRALSSQYELFLQGIDTYLAL